MKRLAPVLLPLAALALASCGDSPDTVLARAREDLGAGNAQEARYRLAEALRSTPGDARMLLLLAQAHLQQGDVDGAERVLSRLGADAGSPQALRLRARIALQRGKVAEALKLLATDTSAEGLAIQAEAYLALGDSDAARKAFQNALAAGGGADMAAQYARFLLKAGELDRTAQVLRGMQARDPGAYQTLVLAGDLAVARGQTDAAMTAFRKAVDAYPDRVPPMLALADLYGAAGRFDDVEPLLDKADAIDPDNETVAAMRLRVLAGRKRWKDIRNILQTRESQLKPGSEAALTYGRALLNLGQPGQARMLAGRAVLMQPDNRDALLLLGEARLATGDAPGAWSVLQPLAAGALAAGDVLRPASRAARAVGAPQADVLARRTEPAQLARTEALVAKGEAALTAGQWDVALGVYRTLLGTREDPEVLARLAFVCTQMGQTAPAIAYADRAVAVSDAPQYLYVAGLARLEGGVQLPRALALLKRAAEAQPDDADIGQALEKAKAAAG